MTEISVQIKLPADTRERWEKFVRGRGYVKGELVRLFIEAVTDPARGPQVERLIQNREPAPQKAGLAADRHFWLGMLAGLSAVICGGVITLLALSVAK